MRVRSPSPNCRSVDRGQIIALWAVGLPMLLGVLALALDGGKLFVSRLHLQNAADAASLASAQEIRDCWDGSCAGTPLETTRRGIVQAAVGTYSAENGGPSTVPECTLPWDQETEALRHSDHGGTCFTWPYVKGGAPQWAQVEVRLRRTVKWAFGGLPGVPSTSEAWARSVGTFQPDVTVIPGSPGVPGTTFVFTDPDTVVGGSTATTSSTFSTTTVIPGGVYTTTNVTQGNCTPGGACGVAFAKSTECPAITYNGAGGDRIGSLMTNGGVTVLGNSGKIINALFVGRLDENGCYINPGRATITNPPPQGPFSPQDWPIPLPNVPTPVPLTQNTLVGNQCWSITSTAQATNGPGVYCSTGSLSFSSTSYVGYTWFAQCISVSGNTHTYQNYGSIPASEGARQKTLFYASGDAAACGGNSISIQGQSNTLNGDMFAPVGKMTVQGGGVAGGTGFFEAQTLAFEGNFASYLGDGPFQGSSLTTVTTTVPDTTTTVFGTTTYTTTVGGTTQTGQSHTVINPGTGSTPDVTQTTGTEFGLGE
jgi:hypothetical protein